LTNTLPIFRCSPWMHRWTQMNLPSSSCFTKDCHKDSLRSASNSTVQTTLPRGQKQHKGINETGSSCRLSEGKEASLLTPPGQATLPLREHSPGTTGDKDNEEAGPGWQGQGCPLQTLMQWTSVPRERPQLTQKSKSIDRKEGASNVPSKDTLPETAR
jgi:hypothetical protein